MMVLVVEDEFFVAADLGDQLTRAGFHVLGPAQSAERALKLVEATPPDVAIVDIGLADGPLAGVDLVRQLSEDYGVACIFCTAQAAEAQKHEHLAKGCIIKPYTFDQVLTALKNVTPRPSEPHSTSPEV